MSRYRVCYKIVLSTTSIVDAACPEDAKAEILNKDIDASFDVASAEFEFDRVDRVDNTPIGADEYLKMDLCDVPVALTVWTDSPSAMVTIPMWHSGVINTNPPQLFGTTLTGCHLQVVCSRIRSVELLTQEQWAWLVKNETAEGENV